MESTHPSPVMSTRATSILKIIRDSNLRVFMTSDLVTLAGMNLSAATHALSRLADQQILLRIKRGVWGNQLLSDLHPYEAIPYLHAPWPTYLSLYTVLADHGVLEEVPQVIYSVSSGRSKRYQTPLGDFHFHHLPAHLMWGYEMKKSGLGHYPTADVEKAFLDLVYLASIPSSPLELPFEKGGRWKLDQKKLRTYSYRFQSKSIFRLLQNLNISIDS